MEIGCLGAELGVAALGLELLCSSGPCFPEPLTWVAAGLSDPCQRCRAMVLLYLLAFLTPGCGSESARVSWDSPCITPTARGPAVLAIPRSWLLVRVVEEHGGHPWPREGHLWSGTSRWEGPSSCSFAQPTPFLGCLRVEQLPVVCVLLRPACG